MLAKLIGLLVPPLCLACGADAGRAAPLCRGCRAVMGASAAATVSAGQCWAPFTYDGPAGALVRALKFGGRTAVVQTMAAQIAALAPPDLLRGTVVPVPVHPQHRRRRGLDHTAALGRVLAQRACLDFRPCLVRGGDPLPQVGRGRRARIRGPAGSIAVEPLTCAPRQVVLIDDVVTTGATIGACITALRDSGTQHISPIAYARTTAR